MDIKLFVSDLDHTLISHELGLTQRMVNAIEKVKEKGIKAAIATGRMHSSAFPYAKALNITTPLISFNGALIKRLDSNEIIAHHPVKHEDAMEVLRFAEEYNAYIQYYSQECFYIEEHNEHSRMYLSETGSVPVSVGKGMLKNMDFEPTKLLIVCPEGADELEKLAVKHFKDRVYVTRSRKTFIEFNNPTASKGSACKALADYYGIGLENVMSVGDGGNDMDMIKRCGLGVAVGNAVDILKDAADYVCPPQNEEGVVEAIGQFLLK